MEYITIYYDKTYFIRHRLLGMQAKLKILAESIKQESSLEEEEKYWTEASEAFKIFWQNKIMNGNPGDFDGKEWDDLDPIIRLMDINSLSHYYFKGPEEK